VSTLEPRERNMLRMSLVHGVSIDRLGEIYGVHRATAARWVERAREKLHEATHARMSERMGIPESDCDSVLRQAWSQLDVSLEEMLLFTAS
jgi:RNA polymerase sigma-70 factor (ECF subfamily)